MIYVFLYTYNEKRAIRKKKVEKTSDSRRIIEIVVYFLNFNN